MQEFSAEPIRSAAQVAKLRQPDPSQAVPFVLEILRRLRAELAGPQIPLIGFAGAPFTLATYLVEGKGDPTRKFRELRGLLERDAEALGSLLGCLAEMTIDYLNAQIDAGAQVVQLFDTWAGMLTEEEYRRFVLPVNRAIAAGLDRAAAPLILYINDAPHLVEAMLDSECDVISVGSRVEIGAREDAAEMVFYVRDNGIGIAPRYHEKIFGLFDKLDPNSEGTGIGLALVKRIVEVHGGHVWVESEGEGKGSTVCFTLSQS